MIGMRSLGPAGPEVSALGVGCMAMSGLYGPADESESIATIHAALEAGVTLFDTGDFYGMGHNEMLLGRALKGRRDRAFIQVKFGALRDPAGGWGGYDARPAALRNFLAYTLRRLRTDYIDLYQPARLDPAVPIEDTAGAIGELIRAGYVRHLGLSEMGAETIRHAHATCPVTAVQIEWSLMSRGVERAIAPVCRELGIGMTAYGVLSRGLLAGSALTGPADSRTQMPRFTAENAARNRLLAEALRREATLRGVSAAALAFAWVLARGPHVVPLIGARRRDQLAAALQGAALSLTAQEAAALERAVPAEAVAGERYAPAQMRMLDSEKS